MPRWEPNARLRLVEAALELFETRGYERSGVAEIAERAGLTKTTFFRHFPDKREVLFAGQEEHARILGETIAQAPATATPLEVVGVALDALAGSLPADRREFGARLRTVIDDHSELQEREALKHAEYFSAMSAGMRARGVEEATAVVAAEIAVLAFKEAFARWADGEPASLTDLTRRALSRLHAAAAALT